jgi:hypothetical protein
MNKALLIFSTILGLAFLSWKWLGSGSQVYFGTPEILGGVVRTDNAAGGKLYFLTGQWEKRVSRIGTVRNSSTRTIGWLNTDLWEIDAATAQPVSRRRIKREKVNGDSKALGLEQGVLWARIPELVGIRLADGEIVADRAKIEARNPSLANLLPKPPQAGIFLTESMQPFKFDPDAGIIVRLDDARVMRIDPLSLEATPYIAPKSGSKPPKPAENPASISRSAMTSISNGMDWWAMVRGLAMQRPDGSGDWLGLLAESEVEEMRERGVVSHQMDFSVPRRQRLYRAKLSQVKEFLGPRTEYKDVVVLPDSPEFLMAALLTQGSGGTGQQSALSRREPDSVFVLSRDRLGDEGHLQLARISGPDGVPVWSVALPLSTMGAWIPGEQYAVMLGPDRSAPRWPKAEKDENPVMQIVSIDLKTGALHSFNPDLHRDWPAEPSHKKP